jgi:hypothetical protein
LSIGRFGRPRHKWENKIYVVREETYLQEVRWGAWTEVIWFRIGIFDGLL